MPKYLEIFTHTFSNAEDMREHLHRDTQNFAKIEKDLKRSGMLAPLNTYLKVQANINMWDNYFVKARKHMTHVWL